MTDKPGYPKWANPNTSTLDFDPAQQITRAKDADKKIAPSVSTPAPMPPSQQTQAGEKEQRINDGSTDVVLSALKKENPQPGTNLPPEKEHHAPCINPSCKSFGKWHPNCLCYAGPGGTSLENSHFAKGGMIESKFCSKNRAHNPKCHLYAEGGPVDQVPEHDIVAPDNTSDTLGHAAVEQGLLGLLKDVGNRKLKDSEKHSTNLMGNYDPQKLAGGPLTGTISPNKLEPIMQRLNAPVQSREPNAEAFRNSVDYLSSAMRGHHQLESNIGELFGSKDFSNKIEPNEEHRKALKEHLQNIQENPEKALDIGGNLGHYLPEHGAQLGSHSAIAMNYLNSLKPQQHQNGPLDDPTPIDKFAEEKYNRALDIANKPLMALYYAKEGTLLPQDIKTLSTIYPGLHKSIANKIGEQLIEAKNKKIEIPYKQRLSLSMLLGSPLDSSMTPMAMQSIMQANAGAQTPQSQPKKASGVELDQLNKVNEMSETPLQARQTEKKG